MGGLKIRVLNAPELAVSQCLWFPGLGALPFRQSTCLEAEGIQAGWYFGLSSVRN